MLSPIPQKTYACWLARFRLFAMCRTTSISLRLSSHAVTTRVLRAALAFVELLQLFGNMSCKNKWTPAKYARSQRQASSLIQGKP